MDNLPPGLGGKMAQDSVLTWNVSALAREMHLPDTEVISLFRQGRSSSAMLTRRLKDAYPTIVPPTGGGLGLMEEEGIFYYFRRPAGAQPASYVCADAEKFPNIPVHVISADQFTKAFGAGTPRVRRAAYNVEVAR